MKKNPKGGVKKLFVSNIIRRCCFLPLLYFSFVVLSVEAGVSEQDLAALIESSDADAEDAAQWLGALESPIGLDAIISSGNSEWAYTYGYAFEGSYTFPMPEFPFIDNHLPDKVESVLVNNIEKAEQEGVNDEVLMKLATTLAAKRLYKREELFDYFFELAKSNDLKISTLGLKALVQTDVNNVGPRIAKILPKLDRSSHYIALRYLEHHPYEPVLPTLRRLVNERSPTRNMRPLYRAIASIGTREAVDFLISELDQYRAADIDSKSKKELLELLGALALLPKEAPLPLNTLTSAVPNRTDALVEKHYKRLIASRQPGRIKEKGGYRALANRYPELDVDFIERVQDEYETRTENLKAPYRQNMKALYERDQNKYYEASQILEDMEESIFLDMAQDLKSKHALDYYAQKFSRRRAEKARKLRFHDYKPNEAVEMMESAILIHQGNTAYLEHIKRILWLADTYRFDLNNISKAVALYREVLHAVGYEKEDLRSKGSLFRGIIYWLPNEIRYLETGQQFIGPINFDELMSVSQVLNVLKVKWRVLDDYKRAYKSENSEPKVDDYKYWLDKHTARHRLYSRIAKREEESLKFTFHFEVAVNSQFMVADMGSVLLTQPSLDPAIKMFNQSDPAGYISAILLGTLIYDGDDIAIKKSRLNTYYTMFEITNGLYTNYETKLVREIGLYFTRSNISVEKY